MGVLFPNYQSPGVLPDSCDFSNKMESSLTTTSASSLRMLGCVSSGPIVLHTFILVSSLRFSPPLQWGGGEVCSQFPIEVSLHVLVLTSISANTYSVYKNIKELL